MEFLCGVFQMFIRKLLQWFRQESFQQFLELFSKFFRELFRGSTFLGIIEHSVVSRIIPWVPLRTSQPVPTNSYLGNPSKKSSMIFLISLFENSSRNSSVNPLDESLEILPIVSLEIPPKVTLGILLKIHSGIHSKVALVFLQKFLPRNLATVSPSSITKSIAQYPSISLFGGIDKKITKGIVTEISL